MRLAKSRIAHNKGTKGYRTVFGRKFYTKPERRFDGMIAFALSIGMCGVIGYTSQNFNKVEEVVVVHQAQAEVVIQPTAVPTAVPTKVPNYTPKGKTLVLMDRHPGLTGKIKATFGNDWLYGAELIAREASFNKLAINPSSKACGLAQALPCSKMKCELEDEDCQLEWIREYVNQRYGGVKNAVLFHDKNNWY